MAMTQEEKLARREARKQLRQDHIEALRINREMDQAHVKQLTITIEWKKSRTWGSNPHAEVRVEYYETPRNSYGRFEHKDGYTCSGCGYDKESTVIAQVFNDFLKYKLWAMSEEQIKGNHGSGDEGPAPYGITNYDMGRGYSGGIGTNCYYRIAEYIGGKFEHVASGKMFDVYRYTDNESGESNSE